MISSDMSIFPATSVTPVPQKSPVRSDLGHAHAGPIGEVGGDQAQRFGNDHLGGSANDNAQRVKQRNLQGESGGFKNLRVRCLLPKNTTEKVSS